MEWLLLRSHTSDEASESDDDSEEDQTGEPSARGEILIGVVTHPQLGEIRIRAVLLRKGALPQWLRAPKHINRVFHAVHGQVQFKQTRGYLTDAGFPALKDRIVIFVDASNLTFEAHNGVWKADREHINNTFWGFLYKEQVTKAIRESETLKELQQQIAREELDTASNEQSVVLFERLLKEDKNLAAFLNGSPPKITFSAPGTLVGDILSGSEYHGKHSPTFLRFEEKAHAKRIKIPINATRPLAGTTDAVNDYFDRPDSPGSLVVEEPAASRFAKRVQLRDGCLTIYLQPIPGELAVGDLLTLRASLRDEGNAHLDVFDVCEIEITQEEEKPKVKPSSPGQKTPGAKEPGKTKGAGSPQPTLALPAFEFTTRDGRKIGEEETAKWPENYSEKEGGHVADFGEGKLKFFINHDNAYHLAAKQRARGDVAKKAITEKYKWGMLVLMMSFEQSYISLADEEKTRMEEFHEQFSSLAAKGAAATVLTIAEILPKILNTADIDTE